MTDLAAPSPVDLAPHELRLLVEVDRTGSFTAAGTALGMTQSAVSHAVRTCERKIGAVLFERGRYGARPTAAGVRAVAHARQILRMLETLRAEARGADADTVAGPLRIAAFRSAAAHVLPAALERLVARYPQVEPQVRIVRELGRGTAGEVADGRADVGIATISPTSAVPDGLLVRELFEEPYVLAHPVGRCNPRGLPLIDWDENCSSYTRQWYAEQDWLPQPSVTVGDDSVVLSMVAQGLGMAIMPRLTLVGAPAGIEVTELGVRPPTRHVGYVAAPAMAHARAVAALIGELRATPIRHLRTVPSALPA
ncbi:LysR family transcriptional regulator [Solihabitans fulvus]|uniref:LysR family transcriptional regulator n=1 Tax=Solihabitans fulvus TaxID=1892852 RepID=UPI001CB764D1|nr:LysR family transcriptional regulator [Solihabitans fulvus]